VKLAVRCFQW